jgi:hypothetical protein
MLSREIAIALAALGGDVIKYPRGAVAGPGCSCAGGPVTGSALDLLPEPEVLRDGSTVMPSGWQPPAELLTDPMLMRIAIARGCVSEIYSDATAIAAGVTTQVDVQPSQGCFLALSRKVIIVDTATLQVPTNAFLTREFVGDCPVTCQNTRAFSDFIDTDNCAWCPMPQVDIGRTVDNQQYHIDVNNPTAASITAQVAIRGICFRGKGCWSGFRRPGTCSVCN